jgi:AcrR family transcriptional regulator
LSSNGRPARVYSAEMPKQALRLRDAGKRLLARRGFKDVTINSVAAEAGEYRTSIAYYFGGKRGLLAAIADEVCPTEACLDAVSVCQQYAPGPERVAAQMAALRSMAEDDEAFRAFFELIPHILREPDLRANLAELYDWYRDLDTQMFGASDSNPDDLKYAAAFVCASVDGLALQALLDPDNFDLKKAFEMLGRAVTALLRDLQLDSQPSAESPVPVEDAAADTPAEDALVKLGG